MKGSDIIRIKARKWKTYKQKDGICKIIDILNNYNLVTYKDVIIEFSNTGYKSKVKLKQVRDGEVKDYLKLTTCGVGFLGENYTMIKDSKLHERAHNIWAGMMQRCYCNTVKAYKNYGAKGVIVDKRWHNYSNFFNDIKLLDGWDYNKFLKKEISLDKDKLQQSAEYKIYSKETCCWLDIYEQNDNKNCTVKNFIAITPEGKELFINTSIKTFSGKYNLTPGHVSDCLLEKSKSHKGWKFKKPL